MLPSRSHGSNVHGFGYWVGPERLVQISTADFRRDLCYGAAMRFVLVFLLAVAACHSEPRAVHPEPGETPPLPPSSGTPVGYLLDAQSDLKLRDEQIQKLQQIDTSLSAQNADIDVQIRQIEKPQPEEKLSPTEVKAGVKPQRRNHAPGSGMTGNADSTKLHEMRNSNDHDALKKAWAILDPEQQTGAKKILEDRGIEVPGAARTREKRDDDAGTVLDTTPIPQEP
jgi:hypothetical protein